MSNEEKPRPRKTLGDAYMENRDYWARRLNDPSAWPRPERLIDDSRWRYQTFDLIDGADTGTEDPDPLLPSMEELAHLLGEAPPQRDIFINPKDRPVGEGAGSIMGHPIFFSDLVPEGEMLMIPRREPPSINFSIVPRHRPGVMIYNMQARPGDFPPTRQRVPAYIWYILLFTLLAIIIATMTIGGF